ncbi:hypothetical protein C8R44DRAFT_738794 [Mycena epipterygia]|nr:hypothetical protein C8R44DRAFT_738794 [Mycena epipterygia]
MSDDTAFKKSDWIGLGKPIASAPPMIRRAARDTFTIPQSLHYVLLPGPMLSIAEMLKFNLPVQFPPSSTGAAKPQYFSMAAPDALNENAVIRLRRLPMIPEAKVVHRLVENSRQASLWFSAVASARESGLGVMTRLHVASVTVTGTSGLQFRGPCHASPEDLVEIVQIRNVAILTSSLAPSTGSRASEKVALNNFNCQFVATDPIEALTNRSELQWPDHYVVVQIKGNLKPETTSETNSTRYGDLLIHPGVRRCPGNSVPQLKLKVLTLAFNVAKGALVYWACELAHTLKVYIPLFIWIMSFWRFLSGILVLTGTLRSSTVEGAEGQWSVSAANDLAITVAPVTILIRQRTYAQKRTVVLVDKLIAWTIVCDIEWLAPAQNGLFRAGAWIWVGSPAHARPIGLQATLMAWQAILPI